MDKPNLEVYIVLVDRDRGNKNKRHPVTFKFQIDNKSFGVSVCHKVPGIH